MSIRQERSIIDVLMRKRQWRFGAEIALYWKEAVVLRTRGVSRRKGDGDDELENGPTNERCGCARVRAARLRCSGKQRCGEGECQSESVGKNRSIRNRVERLRDRGL